MKENLYDLMDWSDIEGIQYADLDCPRCTLGPSVYKGKTLICSRSSQCFCKI